ncbi:sulfotransferase [Limnofasciculus baicalensis]
MEQPTFIVGCDRSGTTLLRLMLNQNPVLHIQGFDAKI